MNTSYRLNITNEVTNHFESLLNNSSQLNKTKIIDTTKDAIENIKQINTQEYVANRIYCLENMLSMLSNQYWTLSHNKTRYILSALQYFVEENDVIPDRIPNIGLLDDCIVIDITTNRVQSELNDFNAYIEAAKIHSHKGDYDVNAWIETKRQELFSRMRHRRTSRSRSRSSRGTSFSI